MTTQEIFDLLWDHYITKSMAPCFTKQEPNHFIIHYQLPDGRRDPFGLIFKHYEPGMEQRKPNELIDNLITPLTNRIAAVINAASQLHDNVIFFEDWHKRMEAGLMRIAEEELLTIPYFHPATHQLPLCLTEHSKEDLLLVSEPDSTQS